MIHDTRAHFGPVAFIDGPDGVHYPARVMIESEVLDATPTRPRRHGPWQLRAHTHDGERFWAREMAAEFDRAPDARSALHADAAARPETFPALAAYHPEFEITGHSHAVGGWLAGRPLRYEQALFPGCFPVIRQRSEQQLTGYLAQGALAIAGMPPASAFQLPAVAAERVVAMLAGVAIGDALGSASESMTASDRHASFGWIDSIRHLTVTDDTQMTLRTLHSLLRRGRADLRDLNRAWTAARIRGIGRTVRTALRQQRACTEQGTDLWGGRVHVNAAGNGSLMRVAGVLAPYALCHPESAPADILLASALTHDDCSANAACLGWSALLLALGQRKAPLADPQAVFDVFLHAAKPVEGERSLRIRCPDMTFTGSLCTFIEQEVIPAHRQPGPVRKRRERWYSGAYLLETVPTALSIIAEYLHDPRAAILEAVNRSWDNDTIASLVASAMGMRHGRDAFDAQWLQALGEHEPTHPEDALSRALALLEPLAQPDELPISLLR